VSTSGNGAHAGSARLAERPPRLTVQVTRFTNFSPAEIRVSPGLSDQMRSSCSAWRLTVPSCLARMAPTEAGSRGRAEVSGSIVLTGREEANVRHRDWYHATPT